MCKRLDLLPHILVVIAGLANFQVPLCDRDYADHDDDIEPESESEEDDDSDDDKECDVDLSPASSTSASSSASSSSSSSSASSSSASSSATSRPTPYRPRWGSVPTPTVGASDRRPPTGSDCSSTPPGLAPSSAAAAPSSPQLRRRKRKRPTPPTSPAGPASVANSKQSLHHVKPPIFRVTPLGMGGGVPITQVFSPTKRQRKPNKPYTPTRQ